MLTLNNKKYLSIVIYCLTIQFHSAYAENFNAIFPTYKPSTANPIKKIESLGLAQLNHGITIPLYNVSIDNPYGGGGLFKEEINCKQNQCRLNFNLSEQNKDAFKIVIFPKIGATLIPRDWNNFEFDMGASSVASVSIYSPKHDQVIQIENTASCGSCSMHKASLYFPKIKTLSMKNQFDVINDPNHQLNIVPVNKNKVFFSYQIPHYNNKTHGIAYYADENDGNGYTNFQEIKVTVKSEQQTWAREILNFYQSTH